ncbi:hypothetical protein AT15_04000 [Kosmotoga arenicorallina S304]|uniref:Alpha/beta hydrolase n=1 Tax=Kosmotoga arenicorallina S304 TaxID=1453497 RepID=A0A176JYY0_9BACT|nr:hypothetical protein [Kosmotoga arenicorallina]OAA29161.1 hypothetical protein AT15_04000 [Kosmotoga arenicorallina S304]
MKKGAISPTLVMLISIALGSILLYLFPIKPLPAPEGEFQIGLRILELDMDKRELASANPNEKRRVLLDIWYPAASSEGYERSKWLREPIYFEAVEGTHNIPRALIEHAGQVRTNSHIDAPAFRKEGGYPVVMLFPGTPALVSLYFNYAETLASNGYIVVGVEQSYANIAVQFNDRAIIYDRSAEGDLVSRISQAESEDLKIQETFQYLSEDIDWVKDYLKKLNSGEQYPDFEGIFDLGNLVLLGHSGGGGIVILRALEDESVKAVVALDPAIFPFSEELLSKGMNAPLFITMSEEWREQEKYKKLDTLMESSRNKLYAYEIDEINHADYAMIDYLSPIAKIIGKSGGYFGRGGEELMKKAVLSFLNEVIKGFPSELEEIAGKAEEIRYFSNMK